MRKQYRQGDVLVEETGKIEANSVSTGVRLLVRGEGRFHGHFIEGDVEVRAVPATEANGFISHYLTIRENGRLVHRHTETSRCTGDHDTLDLPPGTYRVIRQREYNPYLKTIRLLQD